MAKISLPAGFKAISGFGDSWQGNKPGDQLLGKLVRVETIHFEARGKKGKPNYQAARDVAKYHFETKDGARAVLESAGMRPLSQVKKGQTVCIVYVGKKKLTGKNPMRVYEIGVK